jgi:aspartate/methionine/tyrosine aminotransferase
MSDILLAKPKLDKGWIDCSVGEAHIVRDSLFNTFNILPYEVPSIDNLFEYQDSQGYKPLVDLLEDKYQAPVIVCNGAKNALGAIFYALKQSGRNTISLSPIYWALLPPLIEMHGLQWKTTYEEHSDAHLLVQPNNPTGQMRDIGYLNWISTGYKKINIPVIHDAVYFSHIYLPTSYPLQKIGDVQIYSASKAYGLSSARIGWAVFHNTELYKLFQYYMETMTVGVSVLSQMFVYDLLKMMQNNPGLTQKFEATAAASLTRSKQIIKEVSLDILDVPSNMEETNGMFGFFKCHQPEAFNQVKVNPAWGEPFGAPGFVRMNLALPEDQMIEIVRRLNSVKG